MWSRRGYHHTEACDARKRAFLVAKGRAEEQRAAEADAWKKPASSTELPSSAKPSGSAREERAQREPVDEQPQPQPDLGDSEMAMSTETPDAEAIRRTRIVAKRSDPGELRRRCPRGCLFWRNTRVHSGWPRIPCQSSLRNEHDLLRMLLRSTTDFCDDA